MPFAEFVFHGDLLDLSPALVRQQFVSPAAARGSIESLGVPHTEFGRIELNGAAAEGSTLVPDGSRVDVFPYPPGEAPSPAGHRFIGDVHAHTLVRYLRMLGFDTLYDPRWDDPELAEISSREDRILLTMDVGLLKRAKVTYGSWIRHEPPRRQLARLLERYTLYSFLAPYTRCIVTNGLLEPVSRDQVIDQIPPRAAVLHDRFFRCPDCGRVYWEGSHHARMQAFIDELRASGN